MGSRGAEWVAKSDITAYLRCPYAFWLVDRGEVREYDVLPEEHTQLIARGRAFEDLIVQTTESVRVESAEDLLITQGDALILQPPMLENPNLKIYGMPDGIRTAGGALIPLEIKSHRLPRATDRWELAFYWLVLERYRRREAPARGLLVTADGTQHELDITDYDFARVSSLIEDVREARERGVEPTFCRCAVCQTRPEVDAHIREQRGTTLVYGIARARAQRLERMGIRSLNDILDCDAEIVAKALKVSVPTVKEWQHHARSHLERTPIVFGTERLDFDSYIALDLEYISARPGTIYLIGTARVENGEPSIEQWWADEPAGIAENLQRLCALAAEHPTWPIVTWSGESADLLELDKAAGIYGLQESVAELTRRHEDLFLYTERNLRLPIPTLSLKDVGGYFGVSSASEIRGGMHAEALWRRRRRSDDALERRRIQDALMEYNADDLRMLVDAVTHLKTIVRESAAKVIF